MTVVDPATSRSQASRESASESVPPGTAPPPRTTVPPPPARRAREPRQLSMIRLRDVLAMIGALFAALATSGVLWQEISPFSGIVGYVVVTWVLFVLYYTLLVSFDEDRPTVRDRVSAVMVQSLGAVVVMALLFVIVYTFVKGWPALRHLNFYTQDGRLSGPLSPLTESGALHAIVGTLIEIGIAALVSFPLGIGTGVFMAEVGGRFARVVRTVVEAMTALPDIVAGLFIYTVLIVRLGVGTSGFAAACALAITMVPIIARTAEVQLRIVPGGLREASLALGTTRLRTVWLVVLPTARAGLATALILGVARAIGETAAVLLTAGESTFLNVNPLNNPMNSLPLFIFHGFSSDEKFSIERYWGAASVLLVLVLVLFVAARIIARTRPGRS